MVEKYFLEIEAQRWIQFIDIILLCFCHVQTPSKYKSTLSFQQKLIFISVLEQMKIFKVSQQNDENKQCLLFPGDKVWSKLGSPLKIHN